MADPTSSPLTPDELAELKRLHKAATAPPWEHGNPLHFNHGVPVITGDREICRVNAQRLTVSLWRRIESEHYSDYQATAALIAAARNALPRLIAEVEALRDGLSNPLVYAIKSKLHSDVRFVIVPGNVGEATLSERLRASMSEGEYLDGCHHLTADRTTILTVQIVDPSKTANEQREGKVKP